MKKIKSTLKHRRIAGSAEKILKKVRLEFAMDVISPENTEALLIKNAIYFLVSQILFQCFFIISVVTMLICL